MALGSNPSTVVHPESVDTPRDVKTKSDERKGLRRPVTLSTSSSPTASLAGIDHSADLTASSNLLARLSLAPANHGPDPATIFHPINKGRPSSHHPAADGLKIIPTSSSIQPPLAFIERRHNETKDSGQPIQSSPSLCQKPLTPVNHNFHQLKIPPPASSPRSPLNYTNHDCDIHHGHDSNQGYDGVLAFQIWGSLAAVVFAIVWLCLN